MKFNLGDYDLGDLGLGDFSLGDLGLRDFNLWDFNLGDFDLIPNFQRIFKVKEPTTSLWEFSCKSYHKIWIFPIPDNMSNSNIKNHEMFYKLVHDVVNSRSMQVYGMTKL